MTDKPVTYNSGFDYFTPEPNTIDEMRCKACDAVMSVQRNKQIYKYRYPGNTDETHERDVFTCDFADEIWHNQAIAIIRLIRNTPSQKFAEILEDELRSIVKSKTPTKEHWGV